MKRTKKKAAKKRAPKAKAKKIKKTVKKKKAARKRPVKAKKAPAKPKRHIVKKPAARLPDMDRVVIPVSRTVYPLDAIYGAAYVFLDRAYVYLEKEKEDTVKVSLTSKIPVDRAGLMAMGGEFVNELLNQAIRSNLDDSAKKIREYIVVKSHYAQPAGKMDIEGLLDQTLKEAFDEDPLDIAVPWEEKYGKEDKKEKK